jgi:isochorismate synthase
MQDVLKHNAPVIQALGICHSKKVPFAAYKLPGKTSITVVIQKDSAAYAIANLTDNMPEKGFLIAPFLKGETEAYLIKPDIILQNGISAAELSELHALPEKSTDDHSEIYANDTRKEEYLQLVENSIEKINSGEFEKVVLSRVKSIKGSYGAHIESIFQILCESYPNAFVYLFCINGQCWTGATPEPFICSQKSELKTVSLAGTRPYSEEDMNLGNWNKKELLEQEYVTRHIEKTLNKYGITSFTKCGPFIAKAANLLHLRTDFVFSKSEVGNRLASLISALHPTPAVCGMSTGKAMDFITSVERHNREYYTGYLGPVGIDDDIQLYVNLRCLKLYDNCVVLFMGGGITNDSIAEEEWRETEIKAETLLAVLRQF